VVLLLALLLSLLLVVLHPQWVPTSETSANTHKAAASVFIAKSLYCTVLQHCGDTAG
jgi:hypothetical protein